MASSIFSVVIPIQVCADCLTIRYVKPDGRIGLKPRAEPCRLCLTFDGYKFVPPSVA